jgi:hypothetical protein
MFKVIVRVPPSHIPSPVQARQEVFLRGPVQERGQHETLGEMPKKVGVIL